MERLTDRSKGPSDQKPATAKHTIKLAKLSKPFIRATAFRSIHVPILGLPQEVCGYPGNRYDLECIVIRKVAFTRKMLFGGINDL